MEKEGGSTRVKGLAEARRRERMPIRLLLGDLPAAVGAEEDWFALRFTPSVEVRGVSRRIGLVFGPTSDNGAEDTFLRMKADGLIGMLMVSSNVLAFFVGAETTSGSMFSESIWSSVDGE